ncbi:MAG: PKD domain-containing protein [Bacteroidales bacterium]|nr:PKD domain-containing protein [Bacteroidales bacterium]MCF8404523.1 PKD domain-containing protein [Bacteroidales bacterium]
MMKNCNNHRPLPLSPFLWVTMLLMMLVIENGWTQNITDVEYFFDTDPGYNAGTQVPVVPPAPDLTNFNINVSLTGLSDGFHRLFVRAKDENEVWSLANVHAFYKNEITEPLYDLTKVEYFFDTDPGLGNGTNVPFTPGPDISNLDFSIDISGLQNGFHHLFVRTKNQQGQWSLSNQRSFVKEAFIISNPLITSAEYYFDNDPGLGQATPIPVVPTGSDVTLDFSVDLTSLPDGFHQFCVRTKDTQGLWSQTTRRSFVKRAIDPGNQQLTKIEYFFDTDPGLGNGTAIPITPSTDITVTNYIFDITALPDGLHKLFVRGKDEGGVWSLTNYWNFYKKQLTSYMPNLVAAEYFFNNDPGFGQGISIPVPGNSYMADVSFVADLSSKDEGSNKMFVRTKDALGRWSQSTIHQFFKMSVLPALPDIVYAEYYIDNDPGLGLGISIPVPNPGPDVTDLTFQVDQSLLIMGNHMLFLRTKDANGVWSLTLVDEFCHSPIADFSANNVWLGEQTTFTDLSYFTDENTEYYWDVDGDNITDYTLNTGFTHTYASAGTYNARLILISAEGCPDTLIKPVSVFTCSAPTALSVSDTTDTSAILYWSAANMETAWEIEYGPSGFTLGNGTLISNIYNIQYYLDGLASNTSYDFYVRSACYASTVSSWAGPGTFTTLEGAPCSNPTDGGTIASGQSICFNTIPDPFTSLGPATNYTGILEYKWQSSADNIDFIDIPGSDSEGLSYPTALTATTWFRRLARVSCQADWSGAAVSDTIEVSIDGRDRYRTKASGDWDNPATWEVFDGTQWADAVDYPSAANIVCPDPSARVQNGHTVNVNTNIEFGNVHVEVGGTLEVQEDIELGIIADDTLSVYGTLIMHSTAMVNGAGHFRILSGASIHVGSAAGISIAAATGNIRVSGSRLYASGAHYIYEGVANQVTGNAITQNTPANISINAPGYVVTLSQAISISGNLHIVHGTFDVNNNNITLGGNWTNDGIFIPGTATVYFNCTVNTYISTSNFYHVEFAGSDTITAAGSLTVYGNLTIHNYFNAGSFTHYVYGSWINNGIFIYGTSTIQFLGTGTLYISVSNFYNIIFAGSGTYTATGSLTIYGSITINNYFDASTFTHYVYGNWTNNGTFINGTSTIQFMGTGNIYIGASNFYHVIFAGTGTVTALGNLTFYGNVTINNYFDAGSHTFIVYGNWINNGTFIYGTSTVNFVGTGNILIGASGFYNVLFTGTGTYVANGSISIFGDITITTNFSAGAYTMSVYGNWVNNGIFDYGTSTVEFIGSGNITITQNDFYHVIFGGTGIFTATGSLNFYGNVTINSTFNAGSYVHYIYGNWINNGTFVYGTSTIYFVGTVNITVGVTNFYHVVFAGTGTITATGSLTIYGDITITTYFDAGSYNHYLYGNWINNGTFVHGTSTIHFMGTGNINLTVNNFYNVVFDGTGMVTATGAITFYGNVTINNYFNAGTFTHFVYGNWAVNGTFVYGTSTIHFLGTNNILVGSSNFYHVIFACSGTVTATGSLTIWADITINNYFNAGSFSHYIYGNWINNGIFVYGTSTIHFVGSGNLLLSTNEFYHVVFGGSGTITATTSITFYGDVTINNYFDAGTYNHYVHGSWNVTGTFIYGTSTIHFVGTGNAYIGAGSFYHVVFGGSGTITAQGSLSIYGHVTINNYFNAGDYLHYIYGNWTNNGTFVYGTSTIHFVGTGNILIGTSEFYHIVFASTGTIAATGSLTIYGDVTITNYFDAASFEHYVYGNWINNGIFVYGTSTIHFVGSGNIVLGAYEFYHVVFGGTGTITATGTLTFYGDVTINNHFNAGSWVHYVYGNWTNTGTFVYGTSTIHFLGSGSILIGASHFYHIVFAGSGTITANGSLTIYGDLTINNHFNAGSYVHYIYGNWINNGTFVYSTSTIHFVGSANLLIGLQNFYHVVFARTGTITATGSLTIYGDLTITNHFDAGSYIHYIYGNWINSGTFVYSTSTIAFAGSVLQTIGGINESSFYRFTVNNSLGLELNINVTVNYLLTLTEGVIRTNAYVFTVLSSGSIYGGSVTSYIHGRLRCGYNAIGSRTFPMGTTVHYSPIDLNYLTLSGTSLVEVEYVEGVIPGTIPAIISSVANHYYIISQTGGTNFTFTLTMNIPGFIPSGSVWMLRGDGFTVNSFATTSPNFTNVTAFNVFGHFTLGDRYCADPMGLINRYVTLNSAILDWEPGDLESEWNVEYGPAGFTPGTGTMLTNIMEKPLEIQGLNPYSYYEFYVQGICSAESQSNWVGPSAFSTFPKQLDAKIFLEGPYDEGTNLMQKNLANAGLLPLAQPYQQAPWNYSGSEEVVAIPPNIVDWVLLEWRHASAPQFANNSTYIWRKAAFLHEDGSIVDLDGSSLPWIGNPQLTGNLYIIVRHRNHLDVMGNAGAVLQDEVFSYDFSDQLAKVYGGSIGYKQIGNDPVRFGMVSGDGDGNGQIQWFLDKSVWGSGSGQRNYLNGDYDMDGQVKNQDKNDVMHPNLGKGSAIP